MFWESVAGRVAALVAALAALALAGAGLKAKSRRSSAVEGFGKDAEKAKPFSVRTLTYCAICVALALALSMIRLFPMPQGGEVTLCSMLFIVLAGYWFGPKAGILAGVSLGLLKFVISPYAVHPAQILLDYPLAFGALGLSGFFRNRKYGLFSGYAAGCLSRFCMSFISGVIFFSSFAVEKGQHPMYYSAAYNLSYILPEMGITLALLAVPQFRRAIERIKISPMKKRLTHG